MTTPTLAPLTTADLAPLAPELVLIGGAFALLMIDLFVSQRHKVWTHLFSVAVLAVVLVMLQPARAGRAKPSTACSCATPPPMS